ncbi:hypothetical protein ABZZ17_26785 [Streptomyces sp. NPDC006512]|uniref:hypothetical protein n=1 Tax=Streptomyces sp. NPDC006512 TaxID=3154307 RepID=UPI0033A53013
MTDEVTGGSAAAATAFGAAGETAVAELPGTDGLHGLPGFHGLVRICDPAGLPRGTGFVADDRGTVITSHEAVDGLTGLLLQAPGGRTWRAEAADVTPLPEVALALVRTDGLGLRPLPVAMRQEVLAGTYVRLPARGWRQARVLGARAGVTYGAADRFHVLPVTVELAIGTAGRDALGPGGGAGGGPVLDVATGAVLAVLGTALEAEHRSGVFALPLRAAAAAAPAGPLARLLERNSATVPGYGADLNLAGVLELTAATVGAALPLAPGADPEPEPVARPALAAGLAAFTAGDRPVLGLVGNPGTGRTTALAALTAERARGPRPAPTLWLRGADLRDEDPSLAAAAARALDSAARAVTAAGTTLRAGADGVGGLTGAASGEEDGAGPGPDAWFGPAARADAGPEAGSAVGRGAGVGAGVESGTGPLGGPGERGARDGVPGSGCPVRGAGAWLSGGPGEAAAPEGTVERVARLAAAAGRPLLVVLDAPEEMPPQLAHRLGPWTEATARWLRSVGARLVVAAGPEYWERAGALYPPEVLHVPARPVRRLPPALPVGDLDAAEAENARARLGIPADGIREADARHPLTLGLLAGIRAAGVTAGRPGRDEVFGAHLDLVALRVAVRIVTTGATLPPGGPAVAPPVPAPVPAPRHGSSRFGATGPSDARPGPQPTTSPTAVPAPGARGQGVHGPWDERPGIPAARRYGSRVRTPNVQGPESHDADASGADLPAADGRGVRSPAASWTPAHESGVRDPGECGAGPYGLGVTGPGVRGPGVNDPEGPVPYEPRSDGSGVHGLGGGGRGGNGCGVQDSAVRGPGLHGPEAGGPVGRTPGPYGTGHHGTGPHGSAVHGADACVPGEPGAQDPGSQRPGPSDPGLHTPGTSRPDPYEPGVHGPGGYRPGLAGHGPHGPGVTGPGSQDLGAVDPAPDGLAPQGPGAVRDPGANGPGMPGSPAAGGPADHEPGVDGPGADRPGVEGWGAHEPSPHEPGMHEPSPHGPHPHGPRPDNPDSVDPGYPRPGAYESAPGLHLPGVRRLAARVAGRVHEAARWCLGPGQGQLDRAVFEELFPRRTGWASAVLAEGLLVPAGPGYRFAHEELSDWLQAGHLDVPTALDVLVHSGPATSGPPVPRHRVGPVLEALRRLPPPEVRGRLTRLVGALNAFAEESPEPPESPPVHPDRVWWAARLLRETLLGASDATPHLPVLHALAEHVARAGPGEFGGWFWNRLRLAESDRLDLLRRLLPADHRYLEAAGRRLVRAPRLVQPLLCAWFTDERRLRGRPGATVSTAAQALLHTHRGLAADELTEALVSAAHHRADELLAVLAEDEPSALSRAVDRWAHDERPGRRVAAAAYGLVTAPHVRAPADRELLRRAARALLDRPADAALHGSALGILLRDPQVRARYLPDALDCFRDPDRGSRLPASALVAALPVLPDPDAVFAALRARADGEVLRALAALTTPGLARRAGDLVRDHLACRPEDAPHAAAFVDRRLDQGPAAGPVLRPLVLDLLRTAPPAVRAALAGVLGAPGGAGGGPPYGLRGELADVLLREEPDPAVLGAFLDALAAGTRARPEERTRELLRRAGRQLLRLPGGPAVFEHRTVELARTDPAFGALVARWLAQAGAEAAALLGPGARRTVETLRRTAPDVT